MSCVHVDRLSEDACVPPDHMVYLVESLTVICHFCMIDSSQQVPYFSTDLGDASTGNAVCCCRPIYRHAVQSSICILIMNAGREAFDRRLLLLCLSYAVSH